MSLETELAIQVFDGFTLLDYKVSKRFAFRSIKKRQISSIFRIVTARTPVLKTGVRSITPQRLISLFSPIIISVFIDSLCMKFVVKKRRPARIY